MQLNSTFLLSRGAIFCLALAATGCAGITQDQSTPPSVPTIAPSPTTECGDMAAADCAASFMAVMALPDLAGRQILDVTLGRGTWCPSPNADIFSNRTCPGGGLPPLEGGSWIGHAVVTLAGSPLRGYLNISAEGPDFAVSVVVFATPPPT